MMYTNNFMLSECLPTMDHDGSMTDPCCGITDQ